MYIARYENWPPASAAGSCLPNPDPFPGVVFSAGLIIGGILLLDLLLKPQQRPKTRRRRNNEPLEPWKREYVSVRDGWRCSYCGCRVSRSSRHIDHSVSWVNGGTNHLNNLRLACVLCNLSKGPLNARAFVARSI